jgi:ferredoxin
MPQKKGNSMMIAREKPLEEILSSIAGHARLLCVGCAGCTAICLAGGQREVDRFCDEIASVMKKKDIPPVMKQYTVERQCDPLFLQELDGYVHGSDAVLSFGCGAGVQLLAERYPSVPVYPALNTLFVGVHRDVGLYQENCRSCGDCQLAYTGGICPVTRCAKSIFNGPCGGSRGGKCEVDGVSPCAWCEMYERLRLQGRLNSIMGIRAQVRWKNQTAGVLVQKGYETLYEN